MARPKTLRWIENIPEVTWFKPAGLQRRLLDEVSLTLDEIEAIRLADLEAHYQEQVAEKMNVSRQTVGRILASAHKKIAEALVQGKAIRLEGGTIHHRDRTTRETSDPELCMDDSRVENPLVSDDQDRIQNITGNLNRIVVTASGPDLASEVDLRFGRAAYLLVFDLDKDSMQVIENSDKSAETGGKGVRTANKVLQMDVGAVITGKMGSRVLSELSGAGIGLFQIDGGTVRQAVESYRIEVIDQRIQNEGFRGD